MWSGCLSCNQVRGFLKCTLRNRGGTRVLCSRCVCRWRGFDSVELSRQGDDRVGVVCEGLM